MQNKRNLWHKFSINFLGYGYTQAVTVAAQFITVPFFLHHWGSKGYAEWLILTSVPSLLGLLDFGVGQASTSKAIMRAAHNDDDGVRHSLQTSLVFTSAVAILLILITAALNHTVRWDNLLKLTNIDHDQASTILLLLVTNLGITLIGNGPINGCFRAIDKTSQGIFLLATRRVLDIFTTIIALSCGFNATKLSTTLVLSQGLFVIFYILLLTRISGSKYLGFKYASCTEFKSILKPSLGHIGITIGQVLTLQGGLQIINQIASPSIVVAYSMSRTLMRMVLQLGITSSHAIRPELSRLAGEGNLMEIHNINSKISLWIISLSAIFYVALSITGPWIIDKWGQSQVSVNHITLAAIGAHALLNAIWYTSSTQKIATNKHGSVSTIYFVSSIIGYIWWPLLVDKIPPIYIAAIALATPEAITAFYAHFLQKLESFK